jgi:hypothetical protein
MVSCVNINGESKMKIFRRKRRWVIPGILNSGDLLMIYAPSGVGKSVYVTNIIASILNGELVLKLWKSKESKVGLADYEMPEDELKQRYVSVIGYHPAFFLQSFQGERLVDKSHINNLESNIRELDLGVLVIDPLSAAYEVKYEHSPMILKSIDEIHGLARRTGCAIIVVHHTGKPKYDDEGNQLPMTPLGHSTISDSVDIELQILATNTSNKTTLLCTKSRRVRSLIHRGWRRDFSYDPDTLRLTPLHEYNEDKDEILRRLRAIKKKRGLSGRALAHHLEVSERQVRRYLTGENYPNDEKIYRFLDALEKLGGNSSSGST